MSQNGILINVGKILGHRAWSSGDYFFFDAVNFLKENRRREILFGKVRLFGKADLFCRWEGRWFTLHKQPSVIHRNPQHGQVAALSTSFGDDRMHRDTALSSNRRICHTLRIRSFSFFRYSARRTQSYLMQGIRRVILPRCDCEVWWIEIHVTI